MKISNRHGIQIEIDKHPTLIVDKYGRHRGEDAILISIPDAKEYDADLMPDGKTIVINLSNEDALKLIGQLSILIGKNVDKKFKKTYPNIPPF